MSILASAEDLSELLGGKKVLDGVSLSAAEGEHVVLIGANGAGKTTLLKCLAGLRRPQQGRVLLEGRPLNAFSPRERARRITYVPQHVSFAFHYSVADFVAMARYPYRSFWGRTRGDDDRAAWALEVTGCSAISSRIVGELSGGEKQLTLLAAALAQESSLLLLDEPMTGVDPGRQDELHMLLDKLKRVHKKAIITATHEINSAAMTADRIIALSRGRIVFQGKPEDCLTLENLERLYGRLFVTVPHPQTKAPMILPRVQQC